MFRSAAARCTHFLQSSIGIRSFTSLPVIDVGPLVDPKAPVSWVTQHLHT
jgi:hypothetical protein